MRYTQSPLPYAYEALEPVISREIMQLHHDKHHAAYVTGANTALEKLEKARAGEIEIDVKAVLRDLSFHANGHLLHELFWQVMQPMVENNMPDAEMTQLLDNSFGSFEAFQKQFASVAKTVEGSGWAVMYSTPNNELLLSTVEKHNLNHLPGYKTVLALDVWEHAYYLDYKNDRAQYVDKWFGIVNWNFVYKTIVG